MIQTKIKLNLDNKTNESRIIKKTELEVCVPTYNEKKISKVEVYSRKTEMTNCDHYANLFTTANWNYDEENDVIKISVENPNEEIALGNDEYYINYYYQDVEDISISNLNQNVKGKVTIQNGEEEEIIENSKDIELNLTNAGINWVENNIESDIKSINKGKMYANLGNQEVQYVTEYNYKTTLNITCQEKLDSIKLIDKVEKLRNTEETSTINGTLGISSEDDSNCYKLEKNESVYKNTKINKEQFNKVLGEDGYLKIYDSFNNLLITIDKDTPETEDGYYSINYNEISNSVISNIIIETSKPISNGFLEIYHEKEIVKNIELEKEKLQEYNSFKIEIGSIYASDGNNYEGKSVLEIALEESQSKATLSIESTKLSANIENENVEMKIELNNSNENSDLWKHPILFLEFPEDIENVELENINCLYLDELNNAEITEHNIDGKIMLQIELKGMQKEFIAKTAQNGTTIILNAKIKIRDFTPAKENNLIKLYYINENVSTYDNPVDLTINDTEYKAGQTSINVDYIAPEEMQFVQKISNFDENDKVINTIKGDIEGTLPILSDEKIANKKITVINNTGSNAQKMMILGRIAFKGNKAIEDGSDLGTTINSMLKSRINSDIETTIYYSENGEATKDIELETNGWTQDYSSLQNIKSFMVIVDNFSQGQKMNIDYDFLIPANLEHGETMCGDFVCYYISETEEGMVEQKIIANRAKLTTGVGVKLELKQSVTGERTDFVNEGDKLKYKIKVTNTGSIKAENVKIKNKIPKGVTFKVEYEENDSITTTTRYNYYEEDSQLEWTLGDMEPNQTIEVEFEVIVNDLLSVAEYYSVEEGFSIEDGKYYLVTKNEETGETQKKEITEIPDVYIESEASLSADNLEKEIISNKTQYKVKKTYVQIEEESSVDKSLILSEEEEYEYYITLRNKEKLDLKNIEIVKTIPEGIKFKKADIANGEGEIKYDEETRKLTIITDLEKSSYMSLKIMVEVDKMTEGIYDKEITTETAVNMLGEKISNTAETINYIGRAKLEGTIECDVKDNYIYANDMLNYTIKVKNTEKTTANYAIITVNLPQELEVGLCSYVLDGQTYTANEGENNTITIEENLKENQEIVINIKAKAREISEEKELVITATMEAKNFNKEEIGKIKHRLQKYDGSDNSQDIDKDGNISYRIRGLAWLDSNKDGERQDNEQILSNVLVYLLDENNEIVKDKDTGAKLEVITDENGEYCFKKLDEGKYFVVFVYDNENYEITEYQKQGISYQRNSDVISTFINFNGSQREVAITDTLKITNRSITNIDLGLKLKPSFDLEIENSINKIIIQTNNENKVHNYNNTKLAKVDIKAKDIKNATALIEYNIEVKNNGEIEGTANKIASEISKGLSFPSELNSNWYLGNDGKIYSKSLANANIKPGESINIKLILSKKMTENNTGTYSNNAKIEEEYNEKGLVDKNTNNNESKAECIITISTGQAFMYLALVLSILVGLAIVIIIMKEKIK